MQATQSKVTTPPEAQEWELVQEETIDPYQQIRELEERLKAQEAENKRLKEACSLLDRRCSFVKTTKQTSGYHHFFPGIQEPNLRIVELYSGSNVFLVSDAALRKQSPMYNKQAAEGNIYESLFWNKRRPGEGVVDYDPAALAQVGLFVNVKGGNLEESEYRSIESLAAKKPQEEFFKMLHDLLLLTHVQEMDPLKSECIEFVKNSVAQDVKSLKAYFNFFSRSPELFQIKNTSTYLRMEDMWVEGCLKACQTEEISTETIMLVLECLKELALQEMPENNIDAYCWMRKALKRSVSEIVSFVLSPEYVCYEKQDLLPKIFSILIDVFPDLDFDEKLISSLASVEELKRMGYEGLVIDTHIRFESLAEKKKIRRVAELIRKDKFLDLAYGFLAKISYENEDWETCQKHLGMALESRRDSISNVILSMECYIKQGNDQLVMHMYNYILSTLDPLHLRSLYQKAYVDEKIKKNYKEAIKDADKILAILDRLNSSDRESLQYRLESYELQERCYEALGDVEAKERVLDRLKLIRESIPHAEKQAEEEDKKKERCILS